jgi:hypothetical protein
VFEARQRLHGPVMGWSPHGALHMPYRETKPSGTRFAPAGRRTVLKPRTTVDFANREHLFLLCARCRLLDLHILRFTSFFGTGNAAGGTALVFGDVRGPVIRDAGVLPVGRAGRATLVDASTAGVVGGGLSDDGGGGIGSPTWEGAAMAAGCTGAALAATGGGAGVVGSRLERACTSKNAITIAPNAATAKASTLSVPGVPGAVGAGRGTVGSSGGLSRSATCFGSSVSSAANTSPQGTPGREDTLSISISTERRKRTGASGGGVGFPTLTGRGPPWNATAASPFDADASLARRKYPSFSPAISPLSKPSVVSGTGVGSPPKGAEGETPSPSGSVSFAEPVCGGATPGSVLTCRPAGFTSCIPIFIVSLILDRPL